MLWDIGAWVAIAAVLVTSWHWLFPRGLAAHRSIPGILLGIEVSSKVEPNQVVLKLRCVKCGYIYYVSSIPPRQCPSCAPGKHIE